MNVHFRLKTTFPVSAQIVYEAWLDSETHSAMTGGAASCSNVVEDTFTAWDDYISGKNVSLVLFSSIVQSWRTAEFTEEDEDSRLELRLSDIPGGCELELIHSGIPEGQPDYKQGWIDNYFEPMRAYFEDEEN